METKTPSIAGILSSWIAGAIALVAWGTLFWGVLYDPLKAYDDLPPNFTEVAETLKRSQTPTGTYFYPWPRNSPYVMETWLAAHREGPFFELRYVREGADPQAPVKFMGGLIQYLVVAGVGLLLCLWHQKNSSKRPHYVLLMVGAGSMGSLYNQLSGPIWFHLSWYQPILLLGYDLISWVILGVMFSWLLKSK